MEKNNFKKLSITPSEVEVIYGIPKGSLANWRWARVGPKFYKTGARKVLYKVEDIEKWLFRSPIQTKDAEVSK